MTQTIQRNETFSRMVHGCNVISFYRISAICEFIYTLYIAVLLTLVDKELPKSEPMWLCNVSFSLLCSTVEPQNSSVSLNRPSLCVVLGRNHHCLVSIWFGHQVNAIRYVCFHLHTITFIMINGTIKDLSLRRRR